MKPATSSWGSYVRAGFGRRLSLLGERFGIDWLTYNPIHFRHFHEHGLRNAPAVMRVIARTFPEARSYVDVGAGSGVYAAEAQRQGIRVVACEHSSTGRRWASRQGVDCRPFDLTREPPAPITDTFDLSYCFEVAEHLPPALGDRLIAFVAGLAPIAVFSAAHPGQGGTGHINEQPKEYWIERFARAGMQYLEEPSAALAEGFRREHVEASWLITNVMAFGRDRR
ncbi:class I SAM-dependent methyltransferase [Fontivita pretiosa]|uniref:class I SAM-dependent methyltransferase n=1 Tax=Fontivita pretiosa TaxID=2989684 RepID=UPI003D1766EC